MMRHDDRFIDLGAQQPLPRLLVERGIVLFQEITFAGNGFDDALVFEFGVGFGDGIAVDAQFFGEGSQGRERFAGAQATGSGGVAHLVSELEVDWFAGVKIDLKDHASLTVIEHYDSWPAQSSLKFQREETEGKEEEER